MMEALAQWEPDDVVSQFRGYKLRTPHTEEAIRQAGQVLPPNIQGIESQDKREHGLVFHDHGDGRLVLGSHDVGDRNSVPGPPDLYQPTARVHIHSHPYSPGSAHDYPSMADQLMARENPHVDFLVQIPAQAPGAQSDYVIYKGSYPPRFHLTVPNPGNLPVPPHSPDGDGFPPFKAHPIHPDLQDPRFNENGSSPSA
jgi:hypothetical protein